MKPTLTTTYTLTDQEKEYTVRDDHGVWVHIEDENIGISFRMEAVPLLIEALQRVTEVWSA